MRAFTKEQFWEECKRNAPWLLRRDFDDRWRGIWNLAEAMGVRIRVNTYA